MKKWSNHRLKCLNVLNWMESCLLGDTQSNRVCPYGPVFIFICQPPLSLFLARPLFVLCSAFFYQSFPASCSVSATLHHTHQPPLSSLPPPLASHQSHLLYQHPCVHTSLVASSVTLSSLFLFYLHLLSPNLLSVARSHLHIKNFIKLSLSYHPSSLVSPPQVDWPLNIIITDSCMNKYNRLFSFLLQLKHMVWSLRDVWFHLKRTGEKKRVGDYVESPTLDSSRLWKMSTGSYCHCSPFYDEKHLCDFLHIFPYK